MGSAIASDDEKDFPDKTLFSDTYNEIGQDRPECLPQ